MRFMTMIKADRDFEAGVPPDPKMMEAMTSFTEELTRAGVLLATGALAPSSQGIRIVASGGRLDIVDGPFAETKELIAGFAILQTRTREEVLEWGRRFMKIHHDILGPSWEGVSEIRQLFWPEDFNPRLR